MEPSLLSSREEDYAGFWLRAGALAIDAVVVWCLLFVEFAIVGGLWALGLIPLSSQELGEGLELLLALMFWLFPAWP